ncbi:MAG: choice-of-anchor D domain-containing protein [Desulfobacterales bacterium]|nr:choice-of-anchor D domain-containing protein [Desulfobacterales bacterium]
MKNLKWLSVLFCLFTALCLFPSRGKASCWTLQYSFQNGPNIYLNSVWGSSGSDVFAVGGDGTILHYDGISWTDMSSGTSSHLNKVWGNSGSDVFAVGDNGTILHYDGSSWSGMDSGTFYDFRDVWGSSGSDVFAVGVTQSQENGESNSLILHYDGSSWSDMNVDPSYRIYGVWGSSESDVFAVGDGVILHYDGSSWSLMTSGSFFEIWGTSGSDVFAVGPWCITIHYDGTSWNSMYSDFCYEVSDIWGSSGSDVFISGGFDYSNSSNIIQHYDGSSWTRMYLDIPTKIRGLWGSSDSDIFAVGGNSIWHYGTCPISIADVYPGAGKSDSATDITIIGTGFMSGTTAKIGDTDMINTVFSSDTELKATVPPGLDPGTYTVTVINPDTAEAAKEECFTIMADPDDYPDISVSPAFLDFGIVNAVTPGTQKLTVSNTGSADLEIENLLMTGTTEMHLMISKDEEFRIQNDSCSGDTLAASETCTFDVFFSPAFDWYFSSATEGAKSASVRIISNDPDSPVFDVLLNGTAVSDLEEALCWTRQNPLPHDNNLRGIWGSSESDIFAAGDSVIMHYNGSSWTTMKFDSLNIYSGVWGSSVSDIFVVGGEIYSYPFTIGGSESKSVIMHYDGSSWESMNPDTPNYLSGIWGSSGSDVFAVGWYGTILHYDGSSWTDMGSGTSRFLYNVWGSSGSDVFAVGENGTILHYDSSSWTAMDSGTSRFLYDVWGTSGSDVFAVGENGTIIHYEGTSWTATDSGTLNQLTGVWGTSSSDVFAVGENGTILHYDGTSWTDMASGVSNHLEKVWGSSGSDIFIAGSSRIDGYPVCDSCDGVILHYDGSSWNNVNTRTPTGSLGKMWGSSDSDVFALGDNGVVLHYDGSSWNSMDSGTPNVLSNIWGSSGSDVFAVGEKGTIMHYNGSSWNAMNSGTEHDLNGIWGSSGSDVFAVADRGIILHYNGSSWSTMNSGTSRFLYSIWGSSASDIFAVGNYGTILHYDGTSWSTVNLGTKIHLSIEDIGIHFHSIWGSSASDIFAVGYGTILHYDGTSWSAMNSGTSRSLHSIWGSSASNVFAVGDNGTVLHHNGTCPVSISSVSPGAGLSDSATDITITGMNFAPDTKVMIGDTVITDVTIVSLTEIRATVPSGLEPGTYSITVTNPDSAGAVEKDCFTITAAHEYPDISVSTSSHDFGTVNTDTPVKKTLTVSNNGSAVLETGTISITGTNADEFSIQNDKCSGETVPASGSCTFDVVFTPKSEGAKNASAEIPSNDPGATFLNVTLEGTGQKKTGCWTKQTPQDNTLFCIWGSSGSDVFAAGDSGTILHYDGTSWNSMNSGSTDKLYGVWGSSGSDVFAVGDKGTILHYDGSSWNSMNSGSTDRFYGVWGISGSDVFAVGENGIILHYNGTSWNSMNSGISNVLLGIWGSSGSDIFVVGEMGVILHHDGTSWNSMDPASDLYYSVWGSSGSDVFAVGSNGSILHYDGSSWISVDSGISDLFYSMWGSSGSNIFAVGDYGIILHYNGESWNKMTSDLSAEMALTGVWSSSDSDVFVVSESGDILYYDSNCSITVTVEKGDINGDGNIDLADAVLALKVLSGTDIGDSVIHSEADVTGDGAVGFDEVIYILWKVREFL